MAEPPRIPPAPSRRREIRRLLAPALLVALMAVIALVYTHPWMAGPGMRVAVVRFDNETGNKDYDRFADALTRSVTAELSAAAAGRYGVIGKAAILGLPRDRRDLAAIGSPLGARHVRRGQVARRRLGKEGE